MFAIQRLAIITAEESAWVEMERFNDKELALRELARLQERWNSWFRLAEVD